MSYKTKEDRVNTVFSGGGHVVILGAGASIASSHRNKELSGKHLPSMDNFIDIVGLNDIISLLPEKLKSNNFEKLYSNIHSDNPNSEILVEIEKRVFNYFKEMKLPNEPTIYDYLVLSLRSRDIIATFNWDPFLYQAWCRNYDVGENPHIAFLHGNVAIGYSKEDKKSGPAEMTSKKTLNYYEPTKLLFPITQKNYNNDEYTKSQWQLLDSFLSDKIVRRVTIFGYGAPASDIEALKALNKAWGTGEERNMEQFEIIDIRPEDEVIKTWKNFIHSHHYDYATDYFDSSLAYNPRRTFESYFQHNFANTPSELFSASNPVPKDFNTLQELWDWHRNLIDAEDLHYKDEK